VEQTLRPPASAGRCRRRDADLPVRKEIQFAIQFHLAAAVAALLGISGFGVVHQDAAHHARCQGEHLSARGPINVLLICQAQVGLMHQGCGLEGVAGPLGRKTELG
jgi:hypothetical protein